MSAIHHIMTAIDSLQTIPDYLCFTALESGTFTLTIPAAVTATYLSYVEWSKDGRTWNHTDNTSEAVTIDVQVASGDKVYWRGSGNRCTADTTVATSALNVSSDARFDASGHLLSILKGDDYENVSGVQRYTFCNLFYQNTALVHAHDLVLPPVGLTGVFFQLFRGCSSLVSPPASIPLTTIPAWGCRGMYYDCSSLITPTDLIATTYGNTACTFMYRGCASLTRIATLPTVTSLVDSAQFQQMYYGCTSLTRAELYTVTAPFKKQLFSAMFYRCTNLSYIKCLYTDLSADQAFTDWLYGVSSTGTFIQAEGVEWPRGASGIPTGWLAYDEGEDIPNDYEQLDYAGNDSGRARVNVGAVTTVYEAWQVTFRTPVIGTQVICGYYGRDTDADPVQASQSYLYARESPDSFQHQHYRINGDSYSSQNGLLKDIRDTEWHTFKVWFEDGQRHIEFDGVDKGTSTQEYATKKENLDMYLFHYQGTNGYANVHIAEFIRYEEDAETETMHLLPCKRKSDDVVGYWDTIGLQFRTSGNAHALIGGYLTTNENNE